MSTSMSLTENEILIWIGKSSFYQVQQRSMEGIVWIATHQEYIKDLKMNYTLIHSPLAIASGISSLTFRKILSELFESNQITKHSEILISHDKNKESTISDDTFLWAGKVIVSNEKAKKNQETKVSLSLLAIKMIILQSEEESFISFARNDERFIHSKLSYAGSQKNIKWLFENNYLVLVKKRKARREYLLNVAVSKINDKI